RYAFRCDWMGTCGSDECSHSTKSTLNFLPGVLRHWPPMIGVVTTFGTGPLLQCRCPTGVVTCSVFIALATASLFFVSPLAFSARIPTSRSAIDAPSCCCHWRPVFFV